MDMSVVRVERRLRGVSHITAVTPEKQESGKSKNQFITYHHFDSLIFTCKRIYYILMCVFPDYFLLPKYSSARPKCGLSHPGVAGLIRNHDSLRKPLGEYDRR